MKYFKFNDLNGTFLKVEAVDTIIKNEDSLNLWSLNPYTGEEIETELEYDDEKVLETDYEKLTSGLLGQ